MSVTLRKAKVIQPKVTGNLISSYVQGGSGANTGMVVDSAGYLTWGPHNLVANSSNFNLSPWSLYQATVTTVGVSPTAGEPAFRLADASAYSWDRTGLVSDNGVFPAGDNRISFDVKGDGHRYIAIATWDGINYPTCMFDTQTGTITEITGMTSAGGVNLGNGWWRLWARVKTVGNWGLNVFSFDNPNWGLGYRGGDTTKAFLIASVQVEKSTYANTPGPYISTGATVPVYGPRFNYTSGVPRLLNEPQSTNLIVQPNFQSGWIAYSSVIIDLNFTTAPDGTQTAARLLDSTDLNFHNLYSGFNITENTNVTASVFVKKGTASYFGIRGEFTAGETVGQSWAIFDLNAGSFCNVGSDIRQTHVQPLANGWYRIGISFFNTTNYINWLIGLMGSNALPGGADPINYTGANNSVYVWGAMHEINASWTSYIPSGTRTADSSYLYTTLPDYFTGTGANTGMVMDANGKLALVSSGPRFDWSSGYPKLVLEPQRTNYIDRTDFVSWSPNYTTISLANTTAPNGLVEAACLTETTDNQPHQLNWRNDHSWPGTGPFTFSAYVKPITARYVSLAAEYSAGVGAVFDLQTGTVTYSYGQAPTYTFHNATIVPVGDGWFRLSLTYSGSYGDVIFKIAFHSSATPSVGSTFTEAYVGTGKSMYVWGPQAEVSNSATSYFVNNTGSILTRTADTLSPAGNLEYPARITYSDGTEETANAFVNYTPKANIAAITFSKKDEVTLARFPTDSPIPDWLPRNAANTGMVMDASGKLTYGPHNICLMSTNITDPTYYLLDNSGEAAPVLMANNQPDPFGGTTARLIMIDSVYNSVSWSMWNTNDSPPQSDQADYTKYIGSVYLKGAVGGEQTYVMATPNGVSYVRQAVTLTTEWQRYYVSWTTTTDPWYFQVGTDLRDASQSGTPVCNVYIACPQIEAVTYQTSPRPYIPTGASLVYGPRLDWAGGSPRLLLEPEKTNYAQNTQSLSAASWSPMELTIGSYTTGPDGQQSLQKIIETTVADYHYVARTDTFSEPWTTSFYAKAAERSVVYTYSLNASHAVAFFDLANGTANASGSLEPTATITPVGNGVYRCSMSVASTGGHTSISWSIGLAQSVGVMSYAGTTGYGAYIGMIQMEVGGLTSFIPSGSVLGSNRTADGTFAPKSYLGNPAQVSFIDANNHVYTKVYDPFTEFSLAPGSSNSSVQDITVTARTDLIVQDGRDATPASWLSVTGANTGMVYDETGKLVTIASGPRIDFDPVTKECKGWLKEGQRTNYALYTGNFTNVVGNWQIESGAFAMANTTAPDGTLTGTRLTGALRNMYQIHNGTPTGDWTISCHVKPVTASNVRVYHFHVGDTYIGYTDFDFTTESITTANTGGFQKLANGWYRVWTTTSIPSAWDTTIGVQTLSSGEFWIWGPQMETGNSATSFIPNNTASAMTRTADTFYANAFSGRTAIVSSIGANSVSNTVTEKVLTTLSNINSEPDQWIKSIKIP